MVERQIAVVEVILIRCHYYLKTALRFIHPRKSSPRIRLPWVNHVHLVFTIAHFTQILNTVILLIAVNMVKWLLRKTTITDRPDGMV